MSRRARAALFGLAALACAALAATLAGGYRDGLSGQYGPLRPVLVARAELPAKRPLDPAAVNKLLTVRQVPEGFVPPGALSAPAQALGHSPAAPIPPGAFLLAGQLRAPSNGRERHPGRPHLAPGREPVEIAVSGAEALAASGRDPAGTDVDVIVTSEPGPGGRGRTYVAAERVDLLALAEPQDADDGLGAPGAGPWTATLGLTRPEALRLIEAENFAREVRLIASG